ncbi:hypothetical protein LguiA_013653 [Lonicera macranthoides]
MERHLKGVGLALFYGWKEDQTWGDRFGLANKKTSDFVHGLEYLHNTVFLIIIGRLRLQMCCWMKILKLLLASLDWINSLIIGN